MCQFDLPPGPGAGVAHQVARLASELQERGHEITVLTTEPWSSQLYQIRALRVPKSATRHRAVRLLTTPFGFATASFRGQDVIHCHGDSQFLWRPNIPSVRTFYGTARDESRHAQTLKRRLSQAALATMELLAKRVATVTVGISKATEHTLGGLDFVIPCGVNRDMFRPGRKSAKPSILFVGTLAGRKRGHFLLELFASTLREHVPNVELWMVCSDGRGSVIDGVHWFSRVTDQELAALYRRAWVFCSPSTYEGFGVPYIEALASGTAVVATRNTGAREILADCVGAVVVDDADLGHALCRLLTDPGLRRQMQSAARAESARFSWEVVATAYEAAYKAAIDRRAGLK